MIDILLPFAVFLLVAGVIMYIYMAIARRRIRVQQRLQAEQDGVPEPEMILGDLTPALAAQIRITDQNRTELQRELRMAGFYRPTAVLEYAAVRTLLTISPVIMGGVLALFAETPRLAAYCWGVGFLIGILGFSLPRIYIYYRGRARANAIDRGLPVAIDMLNLCLSAGLNLLNSLERIVKELYHAFPVLAFELDIVRRQAELRTLDFALMQFADRTGIPNVRNLAAILCQSEAMGADTLSTLREYGDSIRTNMRQRADEAANKAPFKLLFPAYLMAIGAAILVISPTILEFNHFRKENTLGKERERGLKALESQEKGGKEKESSSQ